jgi:hypothetical protein
MQPEPLWICRVPHRNIGLLTVTTLYEEIVVSKFGFMS